MNSHLAVFPDSYLPDWLAGLTLQSIPAPQIQAAKQAMLDTLSVGWAGAMAEGVPAVLDCLCGGAAGDATLWGQGKKLGARQAAVGNGLLCAALDYDIVHGGATAHTHIVMLPALLALAESRDAEADDFLAAYIGGCEMAVRLGLGTGANPGWGFSSVLGVLAGAAACARLLGLGREGVRAATGIALSRAAGTQQTLIEGSFTKRLQSAFAARDAVEAALLAQCGVSAPRQWVSGEAGFAALYVDLDAAKCVDALGKQWHFDQGTYKYFPSCFCNHAAIVAAQRAAGRVMAAGEISECMVRITPFAARLVGAPFEPGPNPQVAAQFSVQYSVANALLRGGLAVADIAPAAVMDLQVLGLARRIRVEIDDAATRSYTPATVEIRLQDGTAKSARVDTIPGTPDQPATRQELLDKARAGFATGFGALAQEPFERLAARVEGLESFGRMGAFLSL